MDILNDPKSELLKLQASTNGVVARKILVLAGAEVKCRICGVDKDVQAHHKNRNRANNWLDNLEFRCGRCHRKLHGIDCNGLFNGKKIARANLAWYLGKDASSKFEVMTKLN